MEVVLCLCPLLLLPLQLQNEIALLPSRRGLQLLQVLSCAPPILLNYFEPLCQLFVPTLSRRLKGLLLLFYALPVLLFSLKA